MHLRKLKKKDAPLMLEWMHDTDVTRDLKKDFTSMSLTEAETFIEDNYRRNDSNINMAIASDNDEYMGTVSLKNIKQDTAEFAIVMRSKAMGKGYSVYAMKEIMNIGFEKLKLRKIYWCVSPKNHRALRFYDKNGYTRVNPSEDFRGAYTEEEFERFVWYQLEWR